MNPSIHEFIDFLEKEDDTDYGDFKREVDLHLQRMIESLRPLTPEQVWQLSKMREQLLWTYKEDKDLEEMRALLKQEAEHLDFQRADGHAHRGGRCRRCSSSIHGAAVAGDGSHVRA